MRFLLLLALFGFVANAQQAPPPGGVVVNLPVVGSRTPPPVTLPQALLIAEKYIAEKKIPVEQYWLKEVRWMLQQGSQPAGAWGGSCWYLWWVNLNGAMGDYVELQVDMTGRVRRLPSM
jgi:hypothetical protein